ncbi:MAG: two-component sensor histidine kinase [Myxococcaceae bacterium]|nr:two-component sensor histidine kinase [Myxococcaceae bacterium]
MKLATRLWLYGALLPVLIISAVLLGADLLFRRALERSLDQALLTQAAVESVSLFDGPGQKPHLHMATSPLVESVRAFAPEGVLFGPDGEEVMRYPPLVRPRGTAEHSPPGLPGAAPTLSTRARDGTRERMLSVTVSSPLGRPYLLRLTAALAQVDSAQATFRKLSLAALLVVALSLVLVQSWQGRALKRRLGELAIHAEALRAGDLERVLAPESERDELADLRAVIAQATHALKQARDGKERLLADAAHELRTPLTLMRTRIDLALRRERSPDELKAALADTREEVDRLAELATRLLDSAALAHQAEPAVACDLRALVDDALASVRSEAEQQHLSLSLQAPHQLIAWLRPLSVRRAVDNLLANALKHARRTIALELAQHGAVLAIMVTDDGPGIPEAERELIFEPFHRLSHEQPGAGLGLAIVREVARAHHGRAFVRPSEQGGELVLELPAVQHA